MQARARRAARATGRPIDDAIAARAVQALAHGTEEFAARRMDKSVRKALALRQVGRDERRDRKAERIAHRGKEVPQIVILPHPVFCPEGAVLDAPEGQVDLRHAARATTSRSSTPATACAPAPPAT